MRVTIEGVRRWILLAASLLLAIVAGFFIYGRARLRHIEKDLPARLGVNIQQTATGFSYTQTSQGHPLFTLKASKLVQLKAGHALLHDVDITLYGPPGSGRADRIRGSDFDYNQNDGVAMSQGDVEIELEEVGKRDAAGDDGGNTIRVKTSGLMFAQKSGEASTTKKLEFELPRAAGSAVGADYNAKTGVVVLNSQVHITTSSNGRPTTVEAGHATLLRDSRQAELVNASLEYDTGRGRADEATVYFRNDGTAEKVDARGHVRLQSDRGATLDAGTTEILLNEKSQPLQAALGGGLQFASTQADDTMRGSAQEGTLLFAAAGSGSRTSLRHAEFRKSVRFDEQRTGLPGDARGRAEKQVQAERVRVDFARAVDGRGVEAHKAVADGSPVIVLRQIPTKGPALSRRISGDELVATLGSGNHLRTLDGTGNTEIREESGNGARDTSRGDVLHATFVEEPAARPKHAAPARSGQDAGRRRKTGSASVTTLESAVQDGHVVLSETPAGKPGETAAPATLTGWAEHAEYHAKNEVLQLTGEPHIADGQTMQLSATDIEYHRDTQNATASGAVKATYAEAGKERGGAAAPTMGGNGPVHVIADRATMDHATGRSIFRGKDGQRARMWQDADSLLAPAIAIDRRTNALKAWGEGTGTAPVVEANFTIAGGGGKHEPAVARVRSETLVYSDQDRRADFEGSVTAAQGDDEIRADHAQVDLKPARPQAGAGGPAAAEPASGKGSQLERIVATGHVQITQPGRIGTGEKLVYTAAEGKYVLTGTPAEPPQLRDREKGTTTGAALTFFSQTDKVVVSGGNSSVVTETRTPR